ncbi:unnamed protein product [Staurois parvus]|uniref:Endonuclease/exonuclease/phosphatase domain-containing protein n=1 Tax=Staurois parvus TaxID=386267 RepID=A0ABN9HB06_9NEOB|nr:unnamed protein product [Staurois parvus]
MPPQLLKIHSQNVQGFNSPQKRAKVFHHLKSQQIDMVCLQESRFSQSSAPWYLSPHYPTFYIALAPEKRQVVLIAFNAIFPLSVLGI